MGNFDFLFGLLVGKLLCYSDNLSRTLQSTDISATEAQKIVHMTQGWVQVLLKVLKSKYKYSKNLQVQVQVQLQLK